MSQSCCNRGERLSSTLNTRTGGIYSRGTDKGIGGCKITEKVSKVGGFLSNWPNRILAKGRPRT